VSNRSASVDLARPLVVGFGVTGRAVVAALAARGHRSVVIEDRPSEDHRAAATELGIELVGRPDADTLTRLVSEASVLLPSPGVPDHHPVFERARAVGLTVAGEFDLAQRWDQRPVVAVTGTNGKTTVTTMVADALHRSGRVAAAVGNTDVPYVEAIDDPSLEVFVVEASSFRLGHAQAFHPQVAAWINFAPDHLDAHAGLAAYESAKAAIWACQGPGDVAVLNADDAVVMANRPPNADVQVETFSLGPGASGARAADWSIEVVDGREHLVGPDGPLVAVEALARRQPHDLANALATAALASAAGCTSDGLVETLRTFTGLPHRLQPVGSWDGVAWYNDSKATVPQATVAAMAGFESVVLIAGGHPKGLSFAPLASTVPPVRAVVAIGTAAGEVRAVFDGLVPVVEAASMDGAVTAAAELARSGDAVVLSPACASFDWYRNYNQRGDDFMWRVQQHLGPSDAAQEEVARR
jgi:UDP-N-acetylmuramoylalanine--D-glutamate ligase